jgi:DNA invertase Pin-like site-specific DNA recombinase
MNTTITRAHQSKPAYIYVRQSTLAQVRHHHESTERQYALRDQALAMGWPQRSIRVLDRDLGVSGAQIAGREDFKTLVADVSMGQVGAVFALEVSRLARSNLDWHRLLELCAPTHTLVIDADGCYDPAEFNDGLLLGLKGTMAQAELHFLRGRLLGGKLNKARKGELRFPLPVGYCYDDQGRIVVDPDDEVRGAVHLVLRLFRETGSAYAVVQRFAQEGLRFPKRAYGGAWDGQLIWGRLGHGRVLRIRRTPAPMSSAATSTPRASPPRARCARICARYRCSSGVSTCPRTTRATSPWRSSNRTGSAWRATAPTVKARCSAVRRAKASRCSRDCCCAAPWPRDHGALSGQRRHLPHL